MGIMKSHFFNYERVFLFLFLLYQVDALLAEDQILLNTIAHLNATLQQTVLRMTQLEQKVNQLETGSMTSHPILFYAYLSTPETLGQHQAVEFDIVVTNVGNAYDSRHGHFTAPVAGYYHFSVTVMSIPGHSLHMEIVKNGNVIAFAYGANADYNPGSSNFNIELAPTDMIWVRHAAGIKEQQSINNQYSHFSGFLISKAP